MASIANMALQISANTAPFMQGMAAVKQAAESLPAPPPQLQDATAKAKDFLAIAQQAGKAGGVRLPVDVHDLTAAAAKATELRDAIAKARDEKVKIGADTAPLDAALARLQVFLAKIEAAKEAAATGKSVGPLDRDVFGAIGSVRKFLAASETPAATVTPADPTARTAAVLETLRTAQKGGMDLGVSRSALKIDFTSAETAAVKVKALLDLIERARNEKVKVGADTSALDAAQAQLQSFLAFVEATRPKPLDLGKAFLGSLDSLKGSGVKVGASSDDVGAATEKLRALISAQEQAAKLGIKLPVDHAAIDAAASKLHVLLATLEKTRAARAKVGADTSSLDVAIGTLRSFLTSVETARSQVTADMTPFRAALESGLASARAFAARVNRLTGNDLARGVRTGVTTSVSLAADLLTRPIDAVAIRLKSIPKVGELLALPFEAGAAVMATYKAGAESILETAKAARRLGAEVGDVRVLTYAAGGSVETMEKAMFKLQKQMGAAATGSKEAKKGFEALGLDGEKLADMPLTQSLGIIADRIASIPSPAYRAKAAFDLMGKSAHELMPIILRGSAGIEEARRRIDAAGAGLTTLDVAAVEKASRATKQLNLLWEGFRQQVAIGLAPVFVALADEANGAGVSVKGLATTVLNAAEFIATAGAVAVESWKGIVLVWDVFRVGIKVMSASVLTAAYKIVDVYDQVVNAVMNLVRKMLVQIAKQLRDTFGGAIASQIVSNEAIEGFIGSAGVSNAAEGLRKKIKGAWKNIQADKDAFTAKMAGDKSAFDSVRDFFDKVRQSIAKATGKDASTDIAFKYVTRIKALEDEVKDPFAKFREKLDEINELTKSGILTWDVYRAGIKKALGTAIGDDKAFTTPLDDLSNKLAAIELAWMNGALAVEEYGRAIKKTLGSALGDEKLFAYPLERYNQQIMMIDRAWRTGALSEADYFKAVGKAFETLASTAKFEVAKAPTAVTEGSKEYLSAVNRFEREGVSGNVQERIENVLKQIRDQDREVINNGREMTDALRRIGARGI